jgi:hypothetical protein
MITTLGSDKESIAIQANVARDSALAINGTHWKRSVGMASVRSIAS